MQNVILSILNEDVEAFHLAVTSLGLTAFKLEGKEALPLCDMFTEFRVEYGHPRSLFMLGKSLETHKLRIEYNTRKHLNERQSLIKS